MRQAAHVNSIRFCGEGALLRQHSHTQIELAQILYRILDMGKGTSCPTYLSRIYIQHLALVCYLEKEISIDGKNASDPKPSLSGHILDYRYETSQINNALSTTLTLILLSRNIHNPPLPLRLHPSTKNSQRPPRCDQTANPTSPTLPKRPNSLRRLSPTLPPVRRKHRKPRASGIPKVHANRRSWRERELETTGAHPAGADTPRCLQLDHGIWRAAQDEEPGAQGVVVP